MAKEKTITRTLIIGYNYDVCRRSGNTMEIVGSIMNPTVIRSIKEQKKVLVENEYLETDVLVMTNTEQRLYEMSEADFITYATVVTEPQEEPKEEPTQEQ